MRKIFLILSMIGLSACQSSEPVMTSGVPAQIQVQPASSFGALFQAERQSRGLGSVTPNGKLTRVASSHAADMARQGYFDHTSPSGGTVGSRGKSVGYCYRLISENIAKGQPDEATVMKSWMGSPGHRRNILNPKISEYGISHQGDLWVLVMGRPC
jgi:uncharacterized protein YkwD